MYPIGTSSGRVEFNRDFFESVKKSGLSAIEVVAAFDRMEDVDFKELREYSKEYEIDLWSLHLPFEPFEVIDISSVDADLRMRSIDYLTGIIKKAGSEGIERFVIHPSGEPIDDCIREERIKCAMDSLAKLSAVAGAEGGVIAVEDLPRTCLGNTADEMLRLISADDNLRVCFDTNHLLIDDNINFMDKLGEKIVTVHISDYDFINEKHWLPGEGDVNWSELLQKFKDINYSGVWMYEVTLKNCPTMERDRFITYDDLYRNAKSVFAGEKPEVLGKRLINK